MLALFTAIAGFLSPFIPHVIDIWRSKVDFRHEYEMMKLRADLAEKEALWRVQEIEAQADAQEAQIIRQPEKSLATEMLGALKDSGWSGATAVPIFYAFAILDFLRGLVRPGITYAVVGFYLTYKWASFEVMRSAVGPDFNWYLGITQLWTDNDWQVLVLVISYWFGTRAAKFAFGEKRSVE